MDRLAISTVDALDAIRAKLEFLAHVRTGTFANTPSEKATMGEFLILSECCDGLKAIEATVQAHVQAPEQ